MPKKRGNGEGSITKRKDGTWQAQVSIGRNPETGKLKRITLYAKTREEARNKLLEVQGRLASGTYIEPTKITLSSWLDTWLNEYMQSSVRATTLTSYEYLIRVHIKPEIGHFALKDLRAEHVQRLLNNLIKNGRSDGKGGLSPRTVRYCYVVLHAALEQALKNNLILRNVSEAASLPKQKKAEIKILSKEDQLKFLDSIQNNELYVAFAFALATGVRLGEELALRWMDIDLKEGTAKIRQSLSRVRAFDEASLTKTKLIFQEPKTKAGKRTIPIPPSLLPMLKELRKKQLQEKMLIGSEYINNDLIFCNRFGQPLDPKNFTERFHQAIKDADIKDLNFHALRHTYATRLLELNEHPKVVQEILGHSSITMTLDTYSHVMPEIKKAAADKINDLFEIKSPSTKEGK